MSTITPMGLPGTFSGTVRATGEPVYNVKAFGANGDGVTDDTAAIQAAINRAIADGGGQGGGVIEFPATVNGYVVTAPLVIKPATTSLTANNFVTLHLRASGTWNTTIIWKGGSGAGAAGTQLLQNHFTQVFQGIGWKYSRIEGINILVPAATSPSYVVGWDLDVSANDHTYPLNYLYPANSTSELTFTNCTVNFQFNGASGASATATVAGGTVTGVTGLVGGTLYTSAPPVSITGDGTGATAHATVSGGAVTGIVIDTPGSGYTTATIWINGQGIGTGATHGIGWRLGHSGDSDVSVHRYDTCTVTAALGTGCIGWSSENLNVLGTTYLDCFPNNLDIAWTNAPPQLTGYLLSGAQKTATFGGDSATFIGPVHSHNAIDFQFQAGSFSIRGGRVEVGETLIKTVSTSFSSTITIDGTAIYGYTQDPSNAGNPNQYSTTALKLFDIEAPTQLSLRGCTILDQLGPNNAYTAALITLTATNAGYLGSLTVEDCAVQASNPFWTIGTGLWSVRVKDTVLLNGAGQQLAYVNVDTAPITVPTTGAVLAGNEITDSVRNAGISGDGLSVPQATTGIYPAVTNLLLQSNHPNTSPWSKSGLSVVEGNATDANGNPTASTVTLANSTDTLGQSLTGLTAAKVYVVSWWAKRGTATDAKYLIHDDSNNANIVAATSYYSSINSSTWTRVVIAFTTPAGCTAVTVYPLNNSGVTGTVLLWWAQLELSQAAATANAVATPYVNTAGTTATRPAGRIQLPTVGLNQAQGAFIAKFTLDYATAHLPDPGGIMSVFEWANGFPHWLSAYMQANQWRLQRYDGVAPDTAVSVAVNEAAGTTVTLVGVWTPTSVSLSFNGGAFTTVAGTHIPPIAGGTQLDLGGMYVIQSGPGSGYARFAYAAFFSGVLAATDIATINAYSGVPALATLALLAGGAANPQLLWNGAYPSVVATPSGFSNLNGTKLDTLGIGVQPQVGVQSYNRPVTTSTIPEVIDIPLNQATNAFEVRRGGVAAYAVDQYARPIVPASAPTYAAAGANAGTAPPLPLVTGNDSCGTVSVTTGSGSPASGDLADVTFAHPYGKTPVVVVGAANDAAAVLQPSATNASTTGFRITVHGTPGTATTYLFTYHVLTQG